MLHKFFEPGDWFTAKRYGYGAGLPIAWQGWVLVISFAVAVTGVGFRVQQEDAATQLTAGAFILVATALLVRIIRKRTRGGWRWRWGERA